MSYLFVDTTDHMIIGLLDENFEWIDYFESAEVKNSANIHGNIHEMLQKSNNSFDDLKGAFFVTGPGSYTGIRLSEGILQILDWHKLSVYSLYHFDVPSILGVSEGCWFSTAFKGETFLHRWNTKSKKSELVKNEDFLALLETEELQVPLYTHFTKDNDLDLSIEQTKDLIKNNPKSLFSYVRDENLRCPPYYFRQLEDEFKTPSKNI